MKFFLTLVGALSAVIASCLSSPLVLYGIERGNYINVTTSSGTVIKTFYTRARSIKSLAIHSKQDLLFAADDSKIIRLHLLDAKGKRKISGTGELFRNPKANHFESQILEFSSYRISAAESSLLVDETANKLYIGARCFLYELNLNGSGVRPVFTLRRDDCPNYSSKYFRHPSLYKGNFFFTIGLSAIYRAILDGDTLVNITNQNIVLYKDGIRDMAVDGKTGKLFYVNSNHQIQVVTQDELLGVSTTTVQTVLSNYRFTNEVKALAVIGRYMFWCSREKREIYRGKLNEDMNFLPTNDIHTIEREVKTKQIVLYSSAVKRIPLNFLLFVLLVLIK